MNAVTRQKKHMITLLNDNLAKYIFVAIALVWFGSWIVRYVRL